MKLTIEKIIYGGLGLARIPESEGDAAGKRIFVPFTLPGESVEAELAETARGKNNRGFVQGRLTRVLESSLQRRRRSSAACSPNLWNELESKRFPRLLR